MLTGIGQVPIGEALSWNCQDYVMEIWDMLQASGMISEETWQVGRERMLPYYGPDFGGGGYGEDYDPDNDYEDNYEEGDQRVLSQEFVYDSDA